MTRIAVNVCLDRLRSRRWQFWRRRPKPSDEDTALAVAADSRPSAEDWILAGEIKRRLAQALQRLSLRQRAVFTLKHFEDRSRAGYGHGQSSSIAGPGKTQKRAAGSICITLTMTC